MHGIGNYKAMRNDKEIPFGRRIAQLNISDSGYAQAFRYFIISTRAARKVFDDVFSAAKYRAQSEDHDAVAAAVAESKLVANQGSMIDIGSTPNDSNMNPTCNTDKPQSVQTPNAL